MVDGYRVNDPVYAQGTLGRELALDVDLIDRVEFVQGPGSSMYGSNAFLGVVNIISKPQSTIRSGGFALERCSDQTWKARVTLGHRFDNGLETVGSATAYRSGVPLFSVSKVPVGPRRGH